MINIETLENGRAKEKEMLRELQNAHLLQRVGSGDDEKVKMLCLFRTMAIETMAKEGKTGLVEILRLRASFIKNKLKAFELKDNSNFEQLSTLLVQDNPLDSNNVDGIFGRMHNLRVLNLSRTKISNLPRSLSKLKRLKALILRSCSSLTKLPDLSRLNQLIVLDLFGTPLEQCPPGIMKMKRLRRLDLSKTRLESFPIGVVGNLIVLEELLMITNCNCIWGSTEDDQGAKGACIEDLFKLKKLAFLQIHLGNAHALYKLVSYCEDYANLPLRFRFLVGDVYRGGGGSYEAESNLSVSGIDIYKTTLPLELNLILSKLIKDLNVLDVSNLSSRSYLL